jgi:flavin-dependent dehydrogenase
VNVRGSEILVLGGGPAACTAARLLAMWNHDVTLAARPASAASSALPESLTPSCQKFFDLLGIDRYVEAAGFVRTTGNTVWWGAANPRVEMFAGGARGWQATAPVLERVMQEAAREAGVRVEQAALSPDAASARPAVFRIDATGRAGLLARARAGRRHEEGHRTVALGATWRRTAWPLPDPTHTLVESYADGWAWSVPIDEARRAVTVMVDPRTTTMTRGEGAHAAYAAELAKTLRMAALVADAELVEGPHGWDASMYHSTTYAGPGWLVAGDAASFVDPLSSSGVKKALASGWLAAIAVHTALVRPAMADIALRFFADREAEVYARFLSLTRRFLREAAGGQGHPFWAERAEMGEREAERAALDGEREAVVAAHERLRAAPQLALQRGPGIRIESRPAISGAEIVLEPRVVTDTDPTGIRFLHDVDIVTLLELAPYHRQVPDLYEACVRRAGPMDLGSFVTALATAVARGWLVADA